MSELVSIQTLLAGSAALDRMQEEIRQVVQMVAGLVTEEDIIQAGAPEHRTAGYKFSDGQCQWHIIFHAYENLSFSLNYWTLPVAEDPIRLPADEEPRKKCAERIFVVFSGEKTSSMKKEHVLQVHEALPVFLQGMLSRFPRLKKELLVFAEAAEKVG